MTRIPRIVYMAAIAMAGAPVAAAETTSAVDAARCEVWQRERDFAKSVADHDAAAFAEHLHPQAAFGVESKPSIGRETIAAQWQGIIDGSALKLEWYPDVVTIGGDGRTAYSSGPSLYQDPKTGAFRLGRFGSVWQRDQDGAWRVIFDDGMRPQPADEAAVRAFREASNKACPAV